MENFSPYKDTSAVLSAKSEDAAAAAPSASPKDLDSILDAVASEGRHQKLLLYGFLLPLMLLVPLIEYNTVLMVSEVDHWCEGSDPKAQTLPIPLNTSTDTSKCFTSNNATCTRWKYNRTDYDETMVTQFDWVCDKAHYATYALTALNIGTAVGNMFCGKIADRFGRKPVVFGMFLLSALIRTSSVVIAENFNAFLACQVVYGMVRSLTYDIPVVLVAESSSNDYRSWIYSFTWIVYAVSFTTLPIIGWLVRRWDVIALVTTLPAVLIVAYWPVINESPRWLLLQGHIEESERAIRKIAEVNGRTSEVDSDLSKTLLKVHEAQQRVNSGDASGTWFLEVENWPLCKNTIVLVIAETTNQILLYGLTLNTPSLVGNQFLNYVSLGAIEIPASVLAGFVADRFGRRWTQIVMFSIASVTCGACAVNSAFGLTGSPYFLLVLVNVLKFTMTITYVTCYVQQTELFPTVMRSTLVGFATTMAFLGNTATPFVVNAGKTRSSVPYWFFTALVTVSAATSWVLPETVNLDLPETIRDACSVGLKKKRESTSLMSAKNVVLKRLLRLIYNKFYKDLTPISHKN